MKAKITNNSKKDDRVELKVGGKTFILYERAGDLYLEKLGFTVIDICFFTQDSKSTILKIQ